MLFLRKSRKVKKDFGKPEYSLILEPRNIKAKDQLSGKLKLRVGDNVEQEIYGFHVTDKGYMLLENKDYLPTYLGIIFPVLPRTSIKVEADLEKSRYSLWQMHKVNKYRLRCRYSQIFLTPEGMDDSVRLYLDRDDNGNYKMRKSYFNLGRKNLAEVVNSE